ncbi:ATP-dependent DNA helicase [Aphis craccivora]|uniref:ATP-dependent DNA helicase n=1 Tax=Aphis craccivora TaxID=307492 RepID=A0A6G0ZCK5_APHCR|nr:ATP-dependent DNA helicase [Aphis craccivora]
MVCYNCLFIVVTTANNSSNQYKNELLINYILRKQIAGIDLSEDCFTQEQFYVACSRVSSSTSLVILAPSGRTTNAVYKVVL